MEILYRKVEVSERLPEASGYYWIEDVVGEMKSAWFSSLIKDFEMSIIAKYWLEPIPNPTTQLQADKEELLEALEKANNAIKECDWSENEGFPKLADIYIEIESLIQKHKK